MENIGFCDHVGLIIIIINGISKAPFSALKDTVEVQKTIKATEKERIQQHLKQQKEAVQLTFSGMSSFKQMCFEL